MPELILLSYHLAHLTRYRILHSALSVPYVPFAPRGQQQPPSSLAAPFVPGASFKANAAPFVPGETSSIAEPSSTQGEVGSDILLPSDDDFTLGLTDLCIAGQGSGGGVVHPPQGPPPLPPYASHVGSGGGYPPAATPTTGGSGVHQAGGAHVRQAALYMRPPPVASGQTLASSRFASDQLQAELRQRAFLEQAQVDPNNEDTADLPQVRRVSAPSPTLITPMTVRLHQIDYIPWISAF